MTLVEAAKLNTTDVVKSAIIEMYARASDVLRVLPFESIPGNAVRYNQEAALPGVAFRGINEAYTESTGILNPVMDPVVIAGGDLDVDNYIIQTQGEGTRTTHENLKVKALAHLWTTKFIKGDSESDPREFDGLQKRLVGSQLIAAGSTSGGDALSLAKLDEAIDQVDEPTHLVMSRAMRRLMTSAARNPSVTGYITYGQDEFGRQISKYNDLPILTTDGRGQTPVLAFNEVNPGGGSNVGTSIYVVDMMEGMLNGIQNGEMDVRDLGEIDTKPVHRTRVEWYAGLTVYHGRAAARLYGIKNATVTV
jgi:hypothetical protein